MRLLPARWDAALKSLRMKWPGLGGSSSTLSGVFSTVLADSPLPGSSTDYRSEAGPLWKNSAVSICLGIIADAMMESSLVVEARKPSGWEPIDRPEALDAILRPNPYYGADELFQVTMLSLKTDGNAFWLKARNGLGAPAELWWAPPWRFRPVYPADGSKYLSGWTYELEGARTTLKPEDVVHFRWGINPEDERLGLSPLAALVREVVADNQATAYTMLILRNLGIPGVMISPAHPDGLFTPDEQRRLREQWGTRSGGDNRGRPLVMSASVKAEFLSFSPEQLALDKIRAFPEDRIASALGVPSMVAGLTSGSTHKTYANLGEAERAFWTRGIQPLERRIAATMSRELLPDFGLNPTRYRYGWDYSQVAALSENQSEVVKRSVAAYQGGVVKRSEARTWLGLESEAADEAYFAGTMAEQGVTDAGDNDAALAAV